MRTAWAKVRMKLSKKSVRRITSFGSARTDRTNRSDGKKRYALTVKGFEGELIGYMTDEEADAWIESSNRKALVSAAKASSDGIDGIKEFSASGVSRADDILKPLLSAINRQS